jgi:hypothetical protein
MLGDEGKTDTHCMRWAAVIIQTFGPYFFCGSEDELTFSGFKNKAKIIKWARRFRTADECTEGAEIFGSAAHETIISDNSCWPGDFNSGILTFVFSHDSPLFVTDHGLES